MDVDDLIDTLKTKYNFHPSRSRRDPISKDYYYLYKLSRNEKDDGRVLIDKQKIKPSRTINLPRNPEIGPSIYDIKTRKDFNQYFENEFGDLDDGEYAVLINRGGNKGFTWLFWINLQNGKITSHDNWGSKHKGHKQYSNATNSRQNSSTQFALEWFLDQRENLGI